MEEKKSDRRSQPVPKPIRLGPAPGLTAHPAALCGGPAPSLQKISQSSALWTAASDPKMGQKISVEGMTGIFLMNVNS